MFAQPWTIGYWCSAYFNGTSFKKDVQSAVQNVLPKVVVLVRGASAWEKQIVFFNKWMHKWMHKYNVSLWKLSKRFQIVKKKAHRWTL